MRDLVSWANEPRPFFVQHHSTARPHHDLYLELNGRLIGWTMRQPPSPDPRTRRFALRTPDRDLDFGRFEGVIPPGAPGAGVVLIWDLGTFEAYPPRGLSEEAWLARGVLRLHFPGDKLRGLWEMVRWGRSAAPPERWVLLKLKDRHVATSSTLDTAAWSALTGRAPEEVAASAEAPFPADSA